MITAQHLSKQYGAKRAVDDISFSIKPGRVTGFLGPNGAGKSTTMRMIVGLDRPSAGTVTIDGSPYADLEAPATKVGVLLDAKSVHPGRTARNHLRAIAATHHLPNTRVDEVIEMTGLQSVANRRAGKFSLGMGQRLGIATALLGDPDVLVLDEPVNGLDPEGVHWVRSLVRHLADQGRTVMLSSHLMSEMAITADHLIVLGKGKVLADESVSELIAQWTREVVRVQTPRANDLANAVRAKGVTVSKPAADLIDVEGADATRIAERAAALQIPIYGLETVRGSLEEAYLALTGDAVEYQTTFDTKE